MRLFTGNTITTYKTQENAIKAAQKKLGDTMENQRWIVGVNSEGRFHIIFIGSEAFDILHDGFCVAG